MQLRLGAKLLFRLSPLRCARIDFAELKVHIGSVRPQSQRFAVFLLRLRHLPQYEVVFRQGLVRTSGVGIGSQQGIDRLFREQPAGAAKVVEQIGIVGPFGQCCLQICDSLGQLPGCDLCNSQRALFLDPLEVGNRLGCVTLRQQRIPEQLMGSQQIRA